MYVVRRWPKRRYAAHDHNVPVPTQLSTLIMFVGLLFLPLIRMLVRPWVWEAVLQRRNTRFLLLPYPGQKKWTYKANVNVQSNWDKYNITKCSLFWKCFMFVAPCARTLHVISLGRRRRFQRNEYQARTTYYMAKADHDAVNHGPRLSHRWPWSQCILSRYLLTMKVPTTNDVLTGMTGRLTQLRLLRRRWRSFFITPEAKPRM